MTEKTLSTGKRVWIRRLSRPEIRKIKDLVGQRIYPDGSIAVLGANKVQDEWIDMGLAGLEDWKAKNGEIASDDIVMQLTEEEQQELALLIKDAQVINPKKPSSSA